MRSISWCQVNSSLAKRSLSRSSPCWTVRRWVSDAFNFSSSRATWTDNALFSRTLSERLIIRNDFSLSNIKLSDTNAAFSPERYFNWECSLSFSVTKLSRLLSNSDTLSLRFSPSINCMVISFSRCSACPKRTQSIDNSCNKSFFLACIELISFSL